MLKRLAKISILEILLAVPICAVFLMVNLLPKNGETEFTLFNNTMFNQYMRRGWPFDYQVEFDMENFDGRSYDIRRDDFAASSTPKITSVAAVFANLVVMATILGIAHVTIVFLLRPVATDQSVETTQAVP